MTPDEFGEQLAQLREAMTRGLAYYTVWKGIAFRDEAKAKASLEEESAVLGRFRGFFTPVGLALHDMALMQFAKMFDKGATTVSLRRLLGAARGDPSLVPHAKAADLRETSRQMKQSEAVLANLKRMRDQRIAHVDAAPEPVDPLLIRDLDGLAEYVTTAFNTLSVGYDQNWLSLEQMLRTSERHTAEVLGILIEEMERTRQEFDDKMVRIGLDAVRGFETVMERRPNREEIPSVLQSYNMTAEQVQRVQEAYGSNVGEGVLS